MFNEIEIRPARPGDDDALTVLAQLDSGELPPAPLLLAFEGGALRAALSPATGAAIADPFAPTAWLVELLRQSEPPAGRLRIPEQASPVRRLRNATKFLGGGRAGRGGARPRGVWRRR
jgi:hypothetical protein